MEMDVQILQGLTDKQKEHAVRVYEQRSKKLSTAYICWFLIGVHYFYLNKPLVNILYWITGGGFMIWAVIDLFRMRGLVRSANRRILKAIRDEAILLYPEMPPQQPGEREMEECEHLEEREYMTE